MAFSSSLLLWFLLERPNYGIYTLIKRFKISSKHTHNIYIYIYIYVYTSVKKILNFLILKVYQKKKSSLLRKIIIINQHNVEILSIFFFFFVLILFLISFILSSIIISNIKYPLLTYSCVQYNVRYHLSC